MNDNPILNDTTVPATPENGTNNPQPTTMRPRNPKPRSEAQREYHKLVHQFFTIREKLHRGKRERQAIMKAINKDRFEQTGSFSSGHIRKRNSFLLHNPPARSRVHETRTLKGASERLSC